MSPYPEYVYYIKWDLLLEVCHYGIIYSINRDLCVSFSNLSDSKNSKHGGNIGELDLNFNLEFSVLFRS